MCDVIFHWLHSLSHYEFESHPYDSVFCNVTISVRGSLYYKPFIFLISTFQEAVKLTTKTYQGNGLTTIENPISQYNWKINKLIFTIQ